MSNFGFLPCQTSEFKYHYLLHAVILSKMSPFPLSNKPNIRVLHSPVHEIRLQHCFGNTPYLCRASARHIYLSPPFSNTCAYGTFRSFPFVNIVLEEFDYTARVQHVLHTTGCS